MTAASEERREPEPPASDPLDPQSAVELRGPMPRVMRLSPKAIGIASACGCALLGGALIYALQPSGNAEREELYNTEGIAVADGVSGAPRDYGAIPKLGPALPGDLGGPILDAQRRGDIAELPPVGGPQPVPVAPLPQPDPNQAVRDRIAQERETARGSGLFFGGSGAGAGASASPPALPELAAAPATAPPPASEDNRRTAFLNR
jgi:type IV secretion system protein TrbI